MRNLILTVFALSNCPYVSALMVFAIIRQRGIRWRRVLPTGHCLVLYLSIYIYIYSCTFLHWFPRRLPPFIYSSPMYPVGEHTAGYYPAFPPQSDSAAPFLRARLRWSILPLSR